MLGQSLFSPPANPDTLEYHPGRSDLLLAAGDDFFKRGEYTRAIRFYARAEISDPSSGKAVEGYGACLVGTGLSAIFHGDYISGREYIGKALSIGKAAASLFHDAGMALFEKNIYIGALAFFNAWSLEPDNRAYYDLLWKTYTHLGDGKISARLGPEYFAAVLGHGPDYSAYIGLGNVLRHDHRMWLAEDAYRKAIALRPDLPFAYTRLACLLAAERRFTQADELFSLVAARFPGREEIIRLDRTFMRSILGRRDVSSWRFCPEAKKTPNQSELVVFAGCDGKYFDTYAYPLVNSLVQNAGTDFLMHFHVVNPSPDIEAGIELMRHKLDFPHIRCTTEYIDALEFGENAKTYYACARFLVLPQLCRFYNLPVLMLDVDLVVLNPLKPLVDMAGDADICIIADDEELCEPWSKFWADVIYFNNTDKALKFSELASAYIAWFLHAGKPWWFLDQIALTAARFMWVFDEPQPKYVFLPRDIQNSSESLCLFWSLHMSQAKNQDSVKSSLFLKYAEKCPDSLPNP